MPKPTVFACFCDLLATQYAAKHSITLLFSVVAVAFVGVRFHAVAADVLVLASVAAGFYLPPALAPVYVLAVMSLAAWV